MIEIISDKKKWDKVLQSIGDYDTYHTYDYHHLVKNDLEDPVILIYRSKDSIIALALLIRKVSGTMYKDATCVYGYCGPISKNLPSVYDNSSFANALKAYFNANAIIAVFSRLHPYIDAQANILRNIGEVVNLGDIVNIDLSKETNIQRQSYHKRLRTYINKSRRLCNIRLAHTEEDIGTFIDLYYETMRRTQAHERYFFPRAYFFKLMNAKDFECPMLLISDKSTNQIIGGSMFLIKNNIVHYHLSCANEKGLKYNAIKLAIDEMRIQATQKKLLYYNLGGGLGSKEDSLFYFKSSFSRDHRPFKVWKYIVDDRAYQKILEQRGTTKSSTKITSGYFPAYRA